MSPVGLTSHPTVIDPVPEPEVSGANRWHVVNEPWCGRTAVATVRASSRATRARVREERSLVVALLDRSAVAAEALRPELASERGAAQPAAAHQVNDPMQAAPKRVAVLLLV